jgi:hypothetical protein
MVWGLGNAKPDLGQRTQIGLGRLVVSAGFSDAYSGCFRKYRPGR